MNDYIEKPDMQYILHIKSDKKVEKRLIDYCLESVVDVFEDTGLTADVQPISQWISVKDRLPEECKCVLVYDGGVCSIAWRYKGEWESDDYTLATVTYWQPLPEPPKDGDTECHDTK